MKGRTIIAVTGITCITVLEVANIVYYGVDSGVLTLVVGVIASIVGWAFGRKTGM